MNGVRVKDDGHVLQSGDRVELVESQVMLRYQSRGTTVTLPHARAAGANDLVLDARSREVWLRGSRLELSRKEFDVLSLLYRKRGEACSKDELAAAGWAERADGDVGDQEIEQSLRRLRIEPDPSQPRYILTVRGYGYKLAESRETAPRPA